MGPFTQRSPDVEKAVYQHNDELSDEAIMETVHEAAERGHVATDK
jgi:hypothetical protein